LAARKVPEGISDEAAVFMEPAACVLRGLWRSGLPAPDASATALEGVPREPCAVVLGAGSMGLLHVLVLRAVYPRLQILVSDVKDDRLKLACELGADAAHLPGDDHIGAAVLEASEGLGADAVFDTVGGSSLLNAAVKMTREGGSVVLFAHAPDGDRAGFDINHLFKNERRVLGTYSGALPEQKEVFRLILAGRLDASKLVTHYLPFSRFDEGVELCRKLEALKVLFLPENGNPP
jgi:L-iditol 2-dehydrogenase